MTQFSASVFFPVSTGSSHLLHLKSSESSSHLCHQIWIISRSRSSWDIITGSGSSLDLDHHEASSLDLDHHSICYHHWIWIITARSSSLDFDHHSIWIITSYHHWISIITRSGSSLVLSHDSSHHMNFYKASSFSCWL